MGGGKYHFTGVEHSLRNCQLRAKNDTVCLRQRLQNKQVFVECFLRSKSDPLGDVEAEQGGIGEGTERRFGYTLRQKHMNSNLFANFIHSFTNFSPKRIRKSTQSIHTSLHRTHYPPTIDPRIPHLRIHGK